MNKNHKFEYQIVNMDYANLYPETIIFDDEFMREIKRKELNKKRKEKIEKINNLK